MIEQKKEHFIADYLGKMNMNETDYKNDAKNKTDVYYFNVDLKFILKARMHLLAEQFENKIKEAQQYGHKYKCYNCVDGDENEYSEVQANAMRRSMMCDRCGSALEVAEDKNKLSEDDQKKCR